jgi:hypothetical protein
MRLQLSLTPSRAHNDLGSLLLLQYFFHDFFTLCFVFLAVCDNMTLYQLPYTLFQKVAELVGFTFTVDHTYVDTFL